MLKSILAAGVLALAAGPLAHASPAPQPSSASQSPARSPVVASILADYETYALSQDPLTAGQEGHREALSKLPDVTPAADARRKLALERFKARLDAIPRQGLASADDIDVVFLSRVVGDALQELKFDTSRIVFNSEGGPEQMLAYMADAAALRSKDDVEAYLARLSAMGPYIDASAENARRGIRTGFTQPRMTTENTLAQLREQAAMAPDTEIALAPLRKLPESFTAAERTAYLQRGVQIVATQVRPAEQRFVAMMQNEYLPKARATLGAASLPNGRPYYAYLARHFTTTALTPDQIHEIGLQQVALTRAEMDKEMRASGWTGDFAGFIRFLRTDPQFYTTTREDFMEKASRAAKRIDDTLPGAFATLPRLTYGVREVPHEIEEHYTTGRYTLGSPEAGIAGAFMVNTSHLDQRPLYDLPDLAMHEGVPGHHLQIAIQQELPASWYRRHYQVDAFAEGWAHYAERLGIELGIYRTPYERFGMWSAQMWRACRLVADTGIHWKGWTLDQARKCFYENSALAPHNIETELQRYVAWPGQALAYKIGQLKISELRARAERELGDRFELRRFHDVILWTGGNLPLDLLEERVDAWIAEQKALPAKAA